MAKTFSFPHISLLFLRPSRALSLARTVPILLSRKPNNGVPVHPFLLVTLPQNSPFSTAPATPYPLQYELIHHRPAHQTQHHTTTRRRRGHKPLNSNLTDSAESELDQPEHEPSSSELAAELSFEDWVDKKLARKETERSIGKPSSEYTAMDKAKRKYYNKKRQRMYGTDSEDESRSSTGDGFVELKPEFVELKTLHKREEELYFYDTFAYPWEKDKHYKMVYHLEKKYFPEQCLDKAFLQPGELSTGTNEYSKKRREKNVLMFGRMTDGAGGGGGGGDGDGGKGTGEDDKGLIFFEKSGDRKSGGKEISEKKVEEFFNCLKKVPNKNAEVGNLEPFLASRSNGLPPTWDSPGGNVVLINKPKGWTSFTVCGKLRRLVKVKKVGHAGTLDPMATGLLIVCVGKATKIIDRYQGMVKGYTGVFRLGEATSTWDADSPVIQREPWEFIKDAEVQKVAASYLGEIWQVPPMFSAIKVGGERMYEKARRGESMELSPRRISIFQFEIERSLEDRQNLIFRVICSKGTYIRALCADFGKALGSCAHLTALRRESIGEYSADDAFEFHELEEEITKGYL